MKIQQTQVVDILKTTFVPNEKKLLLSFGSLNEVEVKGNNVYISLAITETSQDNIQKLKDVISNRLRQIGAEEINIEVILRKQQQIKNIIAIASGKGGVGKSTVTTNIAVALAKLGKKVGILDADIYGPNIPIMFGISDLPKVNEEKKLVPLEKFSVKIISLGFLLEENSTPVIWRGPLATKAIEQLYNDVAWGELDFLLVDLPPGTGDVALTVAQSLPTKYAIIVTTPQDVSIADASKALSMMKQMNIEVLGIIENMSYFVCPNCGSSYEIFGSGGGERISEQFEVVLLGKLPLEINTREGGDTGVPALEIPGNLTSKEIYIDIAKTIINKTRA